MGHPERRSRIVPVALAALVLGLFVVYDAEDVAELKQKLGLAPRRDARPKDIARSGQLAPCQEPQAWVLQPAMGPADLSLDGFDWRVMQDALALGMTYLAGKPCLDPQSVEEHQGELPRASTTGSAPDAGELASLSQRTGAVNVLVPVIATADGGARRVELLAARSDRSYATEKLASAVLPLDNPALGGEVTATLVADALRALGAKLPSAGPPGARHRAPDLLPPAPFALLARVNERAAKPALRTGDAAAWMELAIDTSTLGYFLTQGQCGLGPYLLVRGAAMALLADLASGGARETRQARAITLLLARRAALARQIADGLSSPADPLAARLALACRGDVRGLVAKGGMDLLVRIACDRAGTSAEVQEHADRLMLAGLARDHVLVGAVRSFDVGPARLHTAMWMAADPTSPDSSPSASALLTGGPGAAQGRTELPRRFAAAARGEAADPRAYAPVSAAPFPYQARRIKADAVALPWVEYALVAKHSWGVEPEADTVLRTLERASSWVSCVNTARSWSGDDASQVSERGGDRWNPADLWNPFVQESAFATGFVMPELGHAGTPPLRLWDRGAASTFLLLRRLSALDRRSGDAAFTRRLIEREISIDPWSPRVHHLLIGLLARIGDRPALDRAAATAVSQLPDTEIVDHLLVDVLDQQANRAAAEKLLDTALARKPSSYALWSRRYHRLAWTHRFGAARGVLREMQKRFRDPVGEAGLLADLAGHHIESGRLKEARELLDAANQVEPWQGTVLGATARLLILEGKVDEGLAHFRKAMERYPQSDGYHADRLSALLTAKRRDLALKLVAEIPDRAHSGTSIAIEVARTFLAAGETQLGIKWIERAHATSPTSARPRDLAMLEFPKMATNLVACKDPAMLATWVDFAATDPEKYSDVVEKLANNPAAEAIDALLDAMRKPGIGRDAAVRLSLISGLDLDLPAKPAAAQLEAARAKVAAWWAPIKPRYQSWQLE